MQQSQVRMCTETPCDVGLYVVISYSNAPGFCIHDFGTASDMSTVTTILFVRRGGAPHRYTILIIPTHSHQPSCVADVRARPHLSPPPFLLDQPPGCRLVCGRRRTTHAAVVISSELRCRECSRNGRVATKGSLCSWQQRWHQQTLWRWVYWQPARRSCGCRPP